MIGAMTAVICILSPLSIQIPVSTVPVSLASLAIFITVFVLGWKYSTISYLIYLLLGLVGLPVFSGFGAGFTRLAGPTGGYLIGFIFITVISGWFIETFQGKKEMYVLGMVLGTIITYLFGTVWLSQMLGRTFVEGLMIGVLPFLPGDIGKVVIAVIVGPMLKKRLRHAGIL